MIKLYQNCRVLLEDFEIAERSILVVSDKIFGVYKPGEPPEKEPQFTIDLGARLVFPGLINAHDHMYHTFWPRVGKGGYRNWFEWEAELYQSDVYKRKQLLSIADLYALGMYRNLLSGVSLVFDHFPREVSENFRDKPLISLLENFGLAHSVSSHSLDWGEGLREEFKQTRGVLPFVLHCEEGFDAEIIDELENLNRAGALAENTVLVGGVGFSDADIELIARKGAKVVWCSASSQFLFQKDPPIAKLLDAGITVLLGTDCALTGSANLLDELRTARRFSEQNLGGRLTPKDLVAMVTTKAAAALRVEKLYGRIAPGCYANMLMFDDFKNDPYESFFNLVPRDVSLVVHRGMPVYGDERFRTYCTTDFSLFSEILVRGVPKLIWGKPMQLLERLESKMGQPMSFPFLPMVEG